MRLFRTISALLFAVRLIASQAAEVPLAMVSDPPKDTAHPPEMMPIALPTHGIKINAMLLTAAGAGLHPTLILFHGLPGNEQNLDLARAIQRAGWNVLTLHYRGSWGSRGHYTFTHCLEDGEAALNWLFDPATAQRYAIDTSRIVVAGHSQGGHLAGWLAGHEDRVTGAVLISPGRSFGNLPSEISRDEVVKRMEESLEYSQGMSAIGDATPEDLADELIRNNKAWDLTQFSTELAKHPILLITSNDPGAPVNDRLAAAVKVQPGAKIDVIHIATDHGYNDSRIALTSTVLIWLDQQFPQRVIETK